MDERLWLVGATLLAFLSTVRGFYCWGARRSGVDRWGEGLLMGAVVGQTLFLYGRGREIGHCPISNGFEITAFLTWSILLTYLAVGRLYRLSWLGFFTAPLVALVNFVALALPLDQRRVLEPMGWWLEMHATLTILAYGPLGLCAIAGALYLWQEQRLKSHELDQAFFRFPGMGDLARVTHRVLVLGHVLLTVGLGAGVWVALEQGMDGWKLATSLGVWCFYTGVLAMPRWFRVGPRRLAWSCLVGYGVLLMTFWLVNREGASGNRASWVGRAGVVAVETRGPGR